MHQVLRNDAAGLARKNTIIVIRVALIMRTVQAVSRYNAIFSFFWINASEYPVREKESIIARVSSATPNVPKSFGDRIRARIIIFRSLNSLSIFLKINSHKVPLLAFPDRLPPGVLISFINLFTLFIFISAWSPGCKLL